MKEPETQRPKLRAFTPEDAEQAARLCSDRHISKTALSLSCLYTVDCALEMDSGA